MRTPFTLDSTRFLQLLNQLERRFDEVIAAVPLSFSGIDDEPIYEVEAHQTHRSNDTLVDSWEFGEKTGAYRAGMADKRIVSLSLDLFGTTCWASLICVASLGFDRALVDQARQFLTRTSLIVRQKGMTVWLYDLINDATMSMLLQQTSARMPVTIRPMSRVQMSRWMHGTGKKRLGSKQQREADRSEYGNQAHRLAAYCMLRWGAPGRSSGDIAQMFSLIQVLACAC